MSGRHMAFPFRVAPDGRTKAPADLADHVRDEIMQLLLTSPGERPFLPSFGGGLRRLVFERNDDASAAVAKAHISQAVDTWLGERVELRELSVDASDSTLLVGLKYRVKATGEDKYVLFQHEQ